jgi:hypothetical protein
MDKLLNPAQGGLSSEGLLMLLQWLTFAIMILIQAIAAAVIITKVRTNVESHSELLKDHEERLRKTERWMFSCPMLQCGVKEAKSGD